MSSSFKTSLLTFSLTAIAHVVLASGLDAEPNANQARVSYSALDLDSEAGVRTLLMRIERAAAQVCGKPTGSKVLPREAAQLIQCRESAVEQAVASLNNPAVTAAYQGSSVAAASEVASR